MSLTTSRTTCPDDLPALEVIIGGERYCFLQVVDFEVLQRAFHAAYTDGYKYGVNEGIKIGVQQTMYKVQEVVQDMDETELFEEIIGGDYE